MTSERQGCRKVFNEDEQQLRLYSYDLNSLREKIVLINMKPVNTSFNFTSTPRRTKVRLLAIFTDIVLVFDPTHTPKTEHVLRRVSKLSKKWSAIQRPRGYASELS